MGKVKAWVMQLQEQGISEAEIEASMNPRHSGLENTEEARQQYEKEFNDWLDFFESKYDVNNIGE